MNAGIHPTPAKETFAAEVERIIGTDRRQEYGSVRESFEQIAKGWVLILGGDLGPAQVAQCMIWMKLCRERHKPKHDNRVDIAGYAACLDALYEDGNAEGV